MIHKGTASDQAGGVADSAPHSLVQLGKGVKNKKGVRDETYKEENRSNPITGCCS